MRRALSLLPGLLRSALAPSTMEQKRLRCSRDFSCDERSRSEGEEAGHLLQNHSPHLLPSLSKSLACSPAELWPLVGRLPTA